MTKKLSLILITTLLLIIITFLIKSPHPNNPAPKNNTTSERIISLAPNITEILYELGLEQNIVAVSSGSDFPPQAKLKTKTGSFWQPNIETIIRQQPDLVITLAFEQQKNTANRLTDLGYNTLTLNITTIDQLYQAITAIGSATKKTAPANQLVQNIKSEFQRIKNLSAKKQKPKVLWIVQPQPLRVAGKNTFIDQLIQIAGGQNAISQTIFQYPPLGTEQLIKSQPDVIIQPAMQNTSIETQLENAINYWQKYPSLPAVKNNRIHIIDSDLVLRLGPRLAQGTQLLYNYLHPENSENTKIIE